MRTHLSCHVNHVMHAMRSREELVSVLYLPCEWSYLQHTRHLELYACHFVHLSTWLCYVWHIYRTHRDLTETAFPGIFSILWSFSIQWRKKRCGKHMANGSHTNRNTCSTRKQRNKSQHPVDEGLCETLSQLWSHCTRYSPCAWPGTHWASCYSLSRLPVHEYANFVMLQGERLAARTTTVLQTRWVQHRRHCTGYTFREFMVHKTTGSHD